MKQLPYEEGTWFAIPLREGGYAVGLMARKGRGGVLLGYFFGPRRSAVPSLTDVEGLSPKEAIAILRFGDLGILQDIWPVIGRIKSWDRSRWPLPAFGRLEDFTGRALRIEYSEGDLRDSVRELQVPRTEIEQLPEDALNGYGAVEIILTKRLRREGLVAGEGRTASRNASPPAESVPRKQPPRA